MNDLPTGASLARYLRDCIEAQAAFAIWRESNDARIQALRSAQPTVLDALLPDVLERDGFILAPFRVADGDKDGAHPTIHLTADGPIRLFAPDPKPDRNAGNGVALSSFSAYACARAPRQLGERDYCALVERGVAAIRGGTLEKIVASRAARRPLGADFDILSFFLTLCAQHRHALVALIGMPGHGLWIVATPETLLNLDGSRIRTMALAGTQPLPPDQDPADALWSAKFIEEQALVSRYIRATLEDAGLTDIRERGPATVRAANLAHLCSWFDAGAGDGRIAQKVRRLIERLHPTSAVCGMPRDPAFAFLAAEEAYDRSYYSGFLGPLIAGAGNQASRAAFHVNLRSAQFIGTDIYLYVGAGVTAFSDPAAEWQETVQKTRTLGDYL